MNLVAQTVTPAGIEVITSSGRVWRLTRAQAQAVIAVTQGDTSAKNRAVFEAVRNSQGKLERKPEAHFARVDRARELDALAAEALRKPEERRAVSDEDNPFLNPDIRWTLEVDPNNGSILNFGWDRIQ